MYPQIRDAELSRSARRNSTTVSKTKQAFGLLLRSLDRDSGKGASHGCSASIGSSESDAHSTRPSLREIYAGLESPSISTGDELDVLLKRLCLSALEAASIKRLLERCTSQSVPQGMRTPLYRYQSKSVWKMLFRENIPRTVPLPNLIPAATYSGDVVYFDADTGAVQLETSCDGFEDVRGGVICEDMGTGKTIVCLASVMYTRGRLAKTSDFVEIHCQVGRESGDADDLRVPSLLHIAAEALLKTSRQRFSTATALPDRILNIINTPPFYFSESQRPALLNRRDMARRAPAALLKVFLSSSTIVIVPDTLVNQWVGEIHKHIEPLQLNFLTISSVNDDIPDATVLATYDLVIITYGRFSLEYSRGGLEFTGVPRVCECPYVGASRERTCHCQTDSYVSPLLQLHWQRLIVDEGHVMASDTTNVTRLASKLHVSSRWCCTGTPTRNIVAEFSRAKEDQQDLSKLGFLFGSFLQMQPYAAERHIWTKNVALLFLRDEPGGAMRLQRILQRCMIRTQKADIEADIVLPPLNERIVKIPFTDVQRLTYNCLISAFHANSVLSERDGEDYFFHPSNRRNLRVALDNMWQSCFWFSSNALVEAVKSTVANAEEGLAKAAQRGYPESDCEILRQVIQHCQRAVFDPVWQFAMRTTHMCYRVDAVTSTGGDALDKEVLQVATSEEQNNNVYITGRGLDCVKDGCVALSKQFLGLGDTFDGAMEKARGDEQAENAVMTDYNTNELLIRQDLERSFRINILATVCGKLDYLVTRIRQHMADGERCSSLVQITTCCIQHTKPWIFRA